MLIPIVWSAHGAVTLESFDFWFRCEVCSFQSRVSVKGVGAGSAVAFYGVGGAPVAAQAATAEAYRSAQEDLQCIPCPACGKHNPKMVTYVAAQMAKRAAFDRLKILLPMACVALGIAGMLALSAIGNGDLASFAMGAFVVGLTFVGPIVSFLAFNTRVHVPSLDKTVPSTVRFHGFAARPSLT
jgi:hypothetical protein